MRIVLSSIDLVYSDDCRNRICLFHAALHDFVGSIPGGIDHKNSYLASPFPRSDQTAFWLASKALVL